MVAGAIEWYRARANAFAGAGSDPPFSKKRPCGGRSRRRGVNALPKFLDSRGKRDSAAVAVLPRQPSGSGVAAALEGQFRCQPRARQPAVSRAVRARETRCECLGRSASHEMTPPARPGPGAASLWCCTWRPSCPLYRVPQGRFKPGHAPSKPVGREGSTRRAPPGVSRFPVTVATAEIENLSHGSKFAPANFRDH